MTEKKRRDDTIAALKTRVADLERQLAQAKASDREDTVQANLEKALRESEMRFRTLAELSSDWYWEQDEQLRFVCPCQGLFEITGILPASYVGKRRWEIEGVAAASEEERRRVDDCVDRREPFFDVLITKRMEDGTARTGLISGVPIFDEAGLFKGYRGVGRDITKQKAAEDAIRDSEARFRTLTELSADWYWEQDEDLRFAFVSDGASRACGTRAEYLLGRRPWECRYMEPSDGNWEPHQADLRAHRPFRDLVLRCLDDRGGVHIVCVSGAPVFDGQGQFRGYRGVSRDVTERERAAEALRESEQRVRLAVEYAGIGTWDRNLVDETIRWSRNIGPMFGFSEDRQEVSKADLDHTIHPEDRARLDDAWHSWRAGLGGSGIEHRIIRCDGAVRWVYQRGSLFQPTDGGPRRILGIIQDITDRKVAEEALREAKEQFFHLAEAIDEVFWVYDDDPPTARYVSPAFERVWGIPCERLYAEPTAWWNQIHPEDRARVDEAFGAWLSSPETERFEIEYRLIRPGGEIRWIRDRAARAGVNSLGLPRISGVAEDITARKTAEQALRESEEKFRLLAENMRDTFWIADPGLTRFEYVSPSYSRISGQPRQALYADADAFLKTILAEDRPVVEAARQRQERGERVEVEFRVVRWDGAIRWVLARSAPMTNSRGEKLVCGITEDITQRKLAEADRIAEALRQRDTLVREVHHRIKNNLQGVAGLLRRSVSRAGDASAVLEAAITQVRSVAVVHGLQAKPRSVGVPLHELLTEIARMVDRFTDSKVSLEGVMPEAPSVLLAEGEAVASALILNEIISNAAKHAAVGAQQPVIRIQVAQEGEHVQVRVRNRGRLPDALDFASGRGLGTGLSLVRALVPAEGMRIAFTQDADIIEVTIDFFPPVVASNEASAALSEGRTPAYGNSGRAG